MKHGSAIPSCLLLAAVAASACDHCASDSGKNNVLLVILDTTRADHLSAYGYARSTTPALEQLAREGELYESAWSHSPWTLPAIATLLTGQPPWIHGATRTDQGVAGVDPDVGTLAEVLSRAGRHPLSGLRQHVVRRLALRTVERGNRHSESNRGNASRRARRRTTGTAQSSRLPAIDPARERLGRCRRPSTPCHLCRPVTSGCVESDADQRAHE